MKSKRVLSLLLSVSLATTTLGNVISSTVVRAASSGQVTRIGGQDRYQTAAQAALSNWSTSDNVILVSGESYADSVSASVLAKELNAPILLTNSNTLNSYAESALSALKPKNVYIVGGEGVISREIRDLLKKSYSVIELGGSNRYATNTAVADELVKQGVDPSNVILVGGQGFSDALTVSSIAASKGEILLLGDNDSDDLASVTNFINSHKSSVTVIGTSSTIDDSTYKAVNGAERIEGGKDRFDTNLKVLASFKNYIKADKVYVANAGGDSYADALVASVLAGKNNSPLVLLDNESSSATVNALDYLKSNLNSSSEIEILGGVGVISEDLENKINNSLPTENSEPQVQTFTGYITTEDDHAASLGEDTADMVYMKMMALSGLGVTLKDNSGNWIFYYFDGDISTDNKDGDGGSWKFNGTGSQLKAWNIVEEQVKRSNGEDKMKPVPVTVTGVLDGSTQTNPGPDADGIDYPVIKVQSITAN